MTPAEQNRDYGNMEVIRIGGTTYVKEPFGPKALKAVEDLDPAGKFIDVLQTTLMRKAEAKRFYI